MKTKSGDYVFAQDDWRDEWATVLNGLLAEIFFLILNIGYVLILNILICLTYFE